MESTNLQFLPIQKASLAQKEALNMILKNDYSDYEYRCLILEEQIVVNHLVLIPTRRPYNFNVIIENKEFLGEIQAV